MKVGDNSEKYTNKQNHMKMKFAFPHNRYLDTLSNQTSLLWMTAFNAQIDTACYPCKINVDLDDKIVMVK